MKTIFIESEMRMPAGMVILPLRSTIVQTSTALIVISPIEFSEDQFRAIEAMGNVTEIVAPSMIHHLHVKQAMKRWPKAVVWGAPGLDKKRSDISWNKIFSRDPWPYENEISAHVLAGVPTLNEVVFFEKASRTLILVDFCFNLTHPKGWAAPLMLRLLGTYKKFGISTLVIKKIEDKEAIKASTQKMIDWDFDRIVMAHGDIISSNAKSLFIDAARNRGLVE